MYSDDPGSLQPLRPCRPDSGNTALLARAALEQGAANPFDRFQLFNTCQTMALVVGEQNVEVGRIGLARERSSVPPPRCRPTGRGKPKRLKTLAVDR